MNVISKSKGWKDILLFFVFSYYLIQIRHLTGQNSTFCYLNLFSDTKFVFVEFIYCYS